MRQLPLALTTGERDLADDVTVSDCNRVATLMLFAWPDWPATALALAGPPGSGKTHLARRWAATVRARPARDAEDAIKLLRAGDHVWIDEPDPRHERPLLHALNTATELGLSILLAAEAPPAVWPVALPDLRSRLAALPLARLDWPDDGLLAAVLRRELERRQLRVAGDLVDYLLRRCERSTGAMRSLIARLDEAGLASGRPVGVALARDLLGDATTGEGR